MDSNLKKDVLIIVQVYGTKNLRFADASIFPTTPAGTLVLAPTAMVAWKASRLIKKIIKT